MSEGSKSMTVKLRLPVNLVKSLEKIARRRGVRRSRLVASLLADWIEDYVEDRFEPFTIRRDRIIIVDNLLGEIIPVRIVKGGALLRLLQILYMRSHEIREEDLREAQARDNFHG